MGWLFCYDSKKALIADRVKTYEDDNMKLVTLAHAIRGNCLWMVKEVTAKKANTTERFIELDLMQKNGSIPGCAWGYKDMEEAMGPYYYSCPLSYLDMAPETCPRWREGVREHAKDTSRKLELGATYGMRNCNLASIRISSLRPLRGYGSDGRLYRFSRRQIGDKIEDPIQWRPVTREPLTNPGQ